MSFIESTVTESGIATITLNRPDKHNALTLDMIELFLAELDALKRNEKLRFLVIRSTGENFCAGADVNWMKQGGTYSQEENLRDAKKLGKLLYQLYHFPFPTIALVQGKAIGGGVGLIACCDIAISTTRSEFSFMEVRLGLIPSVISPYIIGAIGQRQAKRYFLTAQSMDAMEARTLGLIHEAVDSTQLDMAATRLINQLLVAGPLALTHVKKLVRDVYDLPITDEITDLTAERIAMIRASKEGQEGLSAFLGQRPPIWSVKA